MTRGVVRFGTVTVAVMITTPNDGGDFIGSAVIDPADLARAPLYTRCVALSYREAWATLSNWVGEQLGGLGGDL